MSFTQRAKKKLVSLSKRKKMKNSEKEHTRLPDMQVPGFSEDAQRNLSSTMSLPDQVDQSEATNVSKISSKSMSSIETTSAGVTLLSYVSDATGQQRVLHRLHSTPVLSSVPPTRKTTDSVAYENNNTRDASEKSSSINLASSDFNDVGNNACQQTTWKDNHLGKSSLLSRLGHSLDFGLYSRGSQVGFEERDYSLWTSRSPGEVFSSTSSSECHLPADITLTNNRRCLRTSEDTDESQSVEGDLGISEEDSETCDDVFKLDSAESMVNFQGHDNLKSGSFSNNIHQMNKQAEYDNQNLGFDQTAIGGCTCNPGTGESHIRNYGRADVPNVSRADTSIVKKIRFFEHYNEHRSKHDNSNTSRKYLSRVQDSKRSASAADLHTRPSANKHVGNASDDDDDGSPNAGTLNSTKPTASYRVFPNSTSARQRLNFSRFKRSDSIPEVVAPCTCGDRCQGGCEPGGHDREIICQVCHHPQCTTDNDDMPLMLCSECDLEIHKSHDDHLVLDTRPTYDYIEEPNSHAPNFDGDLDDREYQLEIETTHHEIEDLQQITSSKGGNTQIIQQELSNSMTLRNESYNLEAASKHRTGSDGEIIALTRWTNAESHRNEDQKSATLGRNSSLDESPTFPMGYSQDSTEAVTPGLTPAVVRTKAVASDSYFTLRFADSAGKEDECIVVAAAKNKSLREALEPVLQARNMDVSSINVFIEKSQTPLPMSCDTVFLAGNLLEVKEKENRQPMKPLKKTESKRSERKLERSSRRDSFGLVTPLTEAPYSKQRRGSLQLPFREHFFARSDSRNEGSKTAEDVSGSGRGFHRLASTHTDDPANPSTAASFSESRKSRPYRYPKLGSINKPTSP